MENTTGTYVVNKAEHDPSKLVVKQRKIIYPKYENYKACTCGGEYYQTGFCCPTYPAQYEYRCNKCGNILLLKE